MALSNVEIIRALWAALERDRGMPWPPERAEDFDHVLRLDLCDEQMEIRNPAEFPVADEYHGHDGVRKWAAEVWEVFSELHHEIEEVIELDEETVVTVQRTQGRMRHTDIEVDMPWAVVWRIRDGKALSGEGHMSRAQALAAAGR